MNEFLNSLFLDNPVEDYVVVLGALLVIYILKKFLSGLIVSLFYRLIKKQAAGVDKSACMLLLQRPIEFFLLLSTFIFATDKLNFPPKLNFWVYEKSDLHFSQFADGLLDIFFIASVFWIFLRVIDVVAMIMERKADVRDHRSGGQLVMFFRDFIKALISMLGLIIILRMLIGHEAVSKIIGAMGIGAAALALAAKESIENLIGSFIILFDKPFAMGDYVSVNNYSGNVERIGLRSTRIRSDDKTYVTVPNKQMVDSILNNVTLRTQQRGVLKLEIAAATPADTLLELLQEIRQLLDAEKDVMKGFTVYLSDITREAYMVQLFYNTPVVDWAPFTILKERINTGIIRLMEARGVKLAKRSEL